MLMDEDKKSIKQFLYDIYTIYNKYYYCFANNNTLQYMQYDMNEILEIYRINNRYIFNIIELHLYYDNNHNIIIKININNHWQKSNIQNTFLNYLQAYNLLYEIR